MIFGINGNTSTDCLKDAMLGRELAARTTGRIAICSHLDTYVFAIRKAVKRGIIPTSHTMSKRYL